MHKSAKVAWGLAAVLHGALLAVPWSPPAPVPVPSPISIRWVPQADESVSQTVRPPVKGPSPMVAEAPQASPTAESVVAEASAEAPGTPVTDGHPGPSSMDPGPAFDAEGYQRAVRAAIEAKREYPRLARLRNEDGTVLVRFVVDEGGALASPPQVLRGSGSPRLDAAALDAVVRAAPFGPAPTAQAFDLPIVFQLR